MRLFKFSRQKRSKFCNLVIIGIVLIVTYFVLLSINKTSRLQLFNKEHEFEILSNAFNRKSIAKIQNDDIRICYYDSVLVKTNAVDNEWNTKSLSCTGNLRDLFYIKDGTIYVNQVELNEKHLFLQKCTFKDVEWKTDQSYVFGNNTTVENFGVKQSRFILEANDDFIYIKCNLQSKPYSETDTKIKRTLSASDNDKSLLEFNVNDPKSFHKEILELNSPNLIGSLGLPDRKPGMFRSKQSPFYPIDDKQIKNNNTLPKQKYLKEIRGKSLIYEQFVVHVAEQGRTIKKLSQLVKNNFLNPVNVLILVLDSVSQKTFLESFRKTLEILQNPIILHGFNVLGDTAMATLLPLLTGLKHEELNDFKRNEDGGQYVSALPFIWNEFEARGYVTLFAEDQTHLGTFQNHFMGFEEPPVDHYMRPFWLAAESSDLVGLNKRCIGSKPKHAYMLEYLRSFFNKYQGIPKFAVGFISDYEQSAILDGDLHDFFDSLNKDEILSNTLTIVMGDHGTNYGKFRNTFGGMLNERLPMALLSIPDSLKQNKQEIMEHLKTNQKRLTTALDVHAMLRSLTEYHYDQNRKVLGLNLFEEIPVNRTCQDAGISIHYCTCSKYGNINEVPNAEADIAAKKIVDHINQILQDGDGFKRCKKLSLKKIISARFVLPNDVAYSYGLDWDENWLLTNLTSIYPNKENLFLQIVLQTTPGHALFEGTVDLGEQNSWSSSAHIINSKEVSRIDEYAQQAGCIQRIIPSLAKFCYCSDIS